MQLSVDRPIERAAEDVLDRAEPAALFARQVLTLDYSRGFVVGVLGPWGSGKTSYINLARDEFQKAGAHLLDFNPWMFSGADRLVDAFFSEVSSELKLLPELGQAGQELEEYGELLSGLGWVPFVGPWAERARIAMRLVGGGLKKWKGGAASRRKKVEHALSKLARPVIVILDDIDRLTTSEIRQIFQLVRLTASFPNIVYVLAFDRLRVEQALTEDGVPGRAYLEKILQLAVDLPVLPPEALNKQVLAALDASLEGDESLRELDQEVWPDHFFEIIRPLLHTMRDVSRYALAVRGTATALHGEVALADVLALEAIRIFLPDVFVRLPPNIETLTSTADAGDTRGVSQHHKNVLDELFKVAGSDTATARAAVTRLFPAARRYIDNYHFGSDSKNVWLRQRRVAHEDLLRLYLARVPSPSLKAHFAAEQAWKLLSDQEALAAYLRSLKPETLEDVISGLEVFEDDYKPEHVVPGVIVLLNLLPEIPDRPRGMFDFGTGLHVTRVTYRLLRSLKDPQVIERAVRAILPQLTHLSSQWEVISDVGHREGAGHRLISEAAARALEAEWREEVRAAPVTKLEGDPDLLRVYLSATTALASHEAPLEIPNVPRLTLQLLRNARNDTLSQTVGSRAVRREPRLAWDVLVKIVGDEQALDDRIDALLSSGEAIDEELRELVEKYRAGWRPRSE